MAKINSKQKGKRGELELVHELKRLGYKEARRGQQYCGISGDADVVGLKGIHIECKRTERLQLYPAIKQAKEDAKNDELPTVFHRKNNEEWVVIMNLDDWNELYKGGKQA